MRVATVTRAVTVAALVAAAAALAVTVRCGRAPLDAFLGVVLVAYAAVPVLGRAIARSRPGNPIGWILLASGLALPLAIGAHEYLDAALQPGAGLPAVAWAGWLDGWPWSVAADLVPTFGLLLFPSGHLLSRRWRPVAWLSGAMVLADAYSFLFAPHASEAPSLANPTALPGIAGQLSGTFGGAVALLAPLSTLGALSLHLRWRRARRIAEPDAGALALVVPAGWTIAASWWSCYLVIAVTDSSLGALPAELCGLLALGITCWIAIRRYGLFDARLVAGRLLVYGLLTACVVAVYLAVAAAVGLLAQRSVAAPLAAAVAVLVALPLQGRLQRGVNRLVHGLRDEPYAALERMGSRLADAAESDDVLPSVARTVREVLRLPWVSITLGDDVVATSGVGTGDPEEFAMVFAGETIGVLLVGHRERGTGFLPAERRLLTGIAGQVAAAAHAVSLRQDLLRSRERLVAATEEERRRLRRDLHDGLGPALAGVVLGLHRSRRHLTESPATVDAELDGLVRQTQEAVADVRRLVYGLRPPALDELGLVGALDEQARALGDVTVTGAAPALPAGVEVAAYRIALEAMTNSVRHAGASSCTVHIRMDGALHLAVEDDGVGLPDPYRPGVGITSMRERAAELGGSCVVERRSPVGTTVRAVLPLEVG